MLPSDTGLAAFSARRPALPGAWARSRVGAISIVFAALIHAVVLSLLVFENRFRSDPSPATMEIPVEIVIEPPPPPPADTTAPPPPTIDLKPAFDAPRPANEEKVEREATDTSTAPALTDPERQKADAESRARSPLLPEQPAGEIVPPAQSNLEPAAPAPKESAQKKLTQFPPFEPLPNVEFAGAAKVTPIAGGKARSTYLSILYAMIVGHMRSLSTRGASPREKGAIIFTIDGLGNIMQRRIARSSGSAVLDVSALDAVGRAAPFPPPPNGAPIGLTFGFGAR